MAGHLAGIDSMPLDARNFRLVVHHGSLLGTLERLTLGSRLEVTVAELGGSVDELERHLLEVTARRVDLVRLADGQNTLLHTRASTLDHDEVVLHHTVVREATHGGDRLLSRVELSRGRGLVSTVANAVDLLVQLSTVVVTVLTRAGNSEHDVGRVPSTDTGNLTQTLVRLAGQLLGTPTGGHTLVTLTLGDTNDVDVLVLGEQAVHVNGLLEQVLGELNLVSHRATVHLNLHQVGLLLLKARVAQLGVRKNTDDSAVLADTLKLTSDGLATVLGVLLGVLGERLPLAAVPVLVEAALHLVRQVLSPDSGERAEATRSLDVTNDTDDHHRGRLDDRGGLNNLLLVHLGAGAVKVTNDVSHTGLVAHEGRQVDGLLGVILGERLAPAAVARGALAGEETERAVTRVLELYAVLAH